MNHSRLSLFFFVHTCTFIMSTLDTQSMQATATVISQSARQWISNWNNLYTSFGYFRVVSNYLLLSIEFLLFLFRFVWFFFYQNQEINWICLYRVWKKHTKITKKSKNSSDELRASALLHWNLAHASNTIISYFHHKTRDV